MTSKQFKVRFCVAAHPNLKIVHVCNIEDALWDNLSNTAAHLLHLLEGTLDACLEHGTDIFEAVFKFHYFIRALVFTQ